MKELYISPELDVIYFTPVEHLANNDSGAVGSSYEPAVSSEDEDFGMDFI